MKKNYHHGDLRSAAVETALKIIKEKNDLEFTLRDISKELDISHTALYRHFSSKKVLLEVIAEEGFKKLNQSFAKRLKEEDQAKSILFNLCMSYILFAYKNQGHFRSMFHYELRCSTEVSEALRIETENSFNYLQEAILYSMPKNFNGKNLEELANSIWASIHGFALLLIDGQFIGYTNLKSVEKGIATHLELIGIN